MFLEEKKGWITPSEVNSRENEDPRRKERDPLGGENLEQISERISILCRESACVCVRTRARVCFGEAFKTRSAV